MAEKMLNKGDAIAPMEEALTLEMQQAVERGLLDTGGLAEMAENMSVKEDAITLMEEALTLEMQHKQQAVERGLLDTGGRKNEVTKNLLGDLENGQKLENPIIAEMAENMSGKEDAITLMEEALTLEIQQKQQAVERGLLDTGGRKYEVTKNFEEDLENGQKSEKPIVAEMAENMSGKEDAITLMEEALTLEIQQKQQAVERGLLDTGGRKYEVTKNFEEYLENGQKSEKPIVAEMAENMSGKEDAITLMEEALTLEIQHEKQAVERGLLDTGGRKNEVTKNQLGDLENGQKSENTIIAEMAENMSGKEDAIALMEEPLTLEIQQKKQSVERGSLDTEVRKNEVDMNLVGDLENGQKSESPITAELSMTTNQQCAANLEHTLGMYEILYELDAEKKWYLNKVEELKKVESIMKQKVEILKSIVETMQSELDSYHEADDNVE